MMQKPDIAQKLYDTGLSTRQVAECIGMSNSWVHKNVKCRNKHMAAIFRQPASSNHWRSARAAARKTWEYCVGSIPKGFQVHHKDHDYTNRCFSNLMLIDASSRAKLHHPKNPVPRHLRPERQAYQKIYQENYRRSKRNASKA